MVMTNIRIALPVPADKVGGDIVIHSATKFIGGHGNKRGRRRGRVGQISVGHGSIRCDRPSRGYHGVIFHETFGDFGTEKCRWKPWYARDRSFRVQRMDLLAGMETSCPRRGKSRMRWRCEIQQDHH